MNPDILSPILARWKSAARSGLLPAFIDAQAEFGWLTRETIAEVARGLNVPLADAYGVADFYAHLYTTPMGKTKIRVCDDAICFLAGSEKICAALETKLQIRVGETTADGAISLERVPCLGQCDRAPVAMVNESVFENLDAQNISALFDPIEAHNSQATVGAGPILLKNISALNYSTLDSYLAIDGYAALDKALEQLSPAQIIAKIKASGLVGRGGAAFPTGIKWELAAKSIANFAGASVIASTFASLSVNSAKQSPSDMGIASSQKPLLAMTDPLDWRSSPGYVVCNADESETGTFKDRVLIERNPFAVIEALTICAYAIGARYGYIYLRGEYPRACERLQNALNEARARNFLGEKIRGTNFSFEIELRRGAGAYVCGEETALFESLEGKRGEPRAKPPFPTDHGLFGKPTVINNVETLANIPFIVLNGASAYRKFGTEKSPGTRVVCVSGAVEKPGVYEIEMGAPLKKLLFETCGGLRANRKLQTILIGGAAGVFLTPQEIDVALDFQSLNAIGATFGSGAIMVFDDTANLWGVVYRLARFFKDESCGKCFPCQLGTQRQFEVIARMARGQARADDPVRLRELGAVMRDASLCGLGQTAASAIISAFDKKLV
ncbi:MAG: NAD(P)H-dependent oxidoreductase subunit E [Chloroflexi bacterium]|nr:NAD(P)H-dependent oxidoreductase subunit E [Chloroflexota bacterium]